MRFSQCLDHACLVFTLKEWFDDRPPHERSFLHRYAFQFQYSPELTLRFHAPAWEKVRHFFPELPQTLSACNLSA